MEHSVDRARGRSRRCRGVRLALLVLLLGTACCGHAQARWLLNADTSSSDSSDSSSNGSGSGSGGGGVAGLFPAFNLTQVLHEIKQLNLTLPKLNPANFDPKNFTLPKLDDIKLENGMTALEFAKALMTGTISSNTADTNTPDRGLSDVQSGAININPFMDGASMSNALTLAGRDATANSRGIVFGLVGTGRSSSDAAALGLTGAKSSTDTFVINGAGANQNGMSSNLALAPQGRADTSVRAATFDIVGAATTGGLTNALGKKGADAAGLGASMTGLGDSYGAQFANSLAEGSTSSDTGVLAGTLTGAAKATVGSVATSAKRSASTQALSTSKSGLGSTTSKSASLSNAAQNATSKSGSVARSAVGNAASIASTTASGMDADATADSTATTQAGAANAVAMSKAQGVTSASAASNATSRPATKGIRDSLLLRTQLRLPSITLSAAKSSSNSLQADLLTPPAPAQKHWFPFLPSLPSLPSLSLPTFFNAPTKESLAPPTTLPLLGEALVSTVGLKALLPSVPKIVPQLPTLNQTIEVNATAPCNETQLNLNRTANATWLSCNATANGTNAAAAIPDRAGGLPGIGFFDNLREMNEQFMKENMPPSPSPAPAPPAPPAARTAAKPGAPPDAKPPAGAVGKSKTAAVKAATSKAGGTSSGGGGGTAAAGGALRTAARSSSGTAAKASGAGSGGAASKSGSGVSGKSGGSTAAKAGSSSAAAAAKKTNSTAAKAQQGNSASKRASSSSSSSSSSVA